MNQVWGETEEKHVNVDAIPSFVSDDPLLKTGVNLSPPSRIAMEWGFSSRDFWLPHVMGSGTYLRDDIIFDGRWGC